MLFDQYSRYRACSEIVERVSPDGSILDVGSGQECLLGHFLPERTITYVDPLLANFECEDDTRIAGNVFDPKLDNQKFDYVCSIDTLEHVPESVRSNFVERISSLADKGIVLGFPCSDDDAAFQADKIIAGAYRKAYKKEYSWLDEHFRHILPRKTEVVTKLQSLGWTVSVIGHGHAPWLSLLLSVVVCGWEIPEAHSDILRISKRFNEELYQYDFNPPFYRWYVVAFKNPLLSIPFKFGVSINDSAIRCFSDILADAYGSMFSLLLNSKESCVLKSIAAAAERDAAVAERDAAVTERDAALTERDAALTLVETIHNSSSWRISRPLRLIARIFRYGLLDEDRRKLVQGLRAFYHRLPLPAPAKKTLRWSYNRILGDPYRAIRRRILAGAKFHFPLIKPAAQQIAVPDYIVWGVIDWHFRQQRPQQLAQALAVSGRRVFYISALIVDDERAGFDMEPLDVEGRLFQIKLYVKGAPVIYSSAPGLKAVAQLRDSIGEVLEWADSRQVVSLVQHPFWYDIATVLPNSKVVYDCMDHHEGFGNTASEILSLERALFRDADLTMTTSERLDQIVAESTERRTLIRNAGDFEHFAHQPATIYRDPQGRRIIGYYGAIAEWFDQHLVEAVARQFIDCCVLLIGADTVNARAKLGQLPNVKFIGEVSYAELPYYLHAFDVCLLPFKVITLTLATNPVKVYEYLSAGKSVVSVDLPEMKQFGGLVRVAKNTEGFLSGVADVLNSPEATAKISQRQVFAKKQTWNHRVDALISNAEKTPGYDPEVSVVVLTYNNLDFTRACLASLDEHTNYDHLEIIVVDNASTDGTREFLSKWADAAHNHKLILNDDNRGFAVANNQGLSVACGEYLVLLNNDTYVTPGWVRTLVKHLKRDKSIGLIGPVTNNIGNEARININYGNMSEMLRASTRYTRKHVGKIFPLRTAAFFCVMMPRNVYDRVGPLDEAFGRGFFEDDDYCRRIEQIGLRIVCAEDVFVHHHLSASFNNLRSQERQALFEQNKAVYEAKWGKWIPHVFREDAAHPSVPKVFKGAQHVSGRCNVCGNDSRFFYTDVTLWRESLTCEYCLTTSRYRSIARGILRAINELTEVNAKSLAALPRTGVQHKLRIYDTQLPFFYESCAYPLPDLLKAISWIDIDLSLFKPKLPMGQRLAPGVTNQNLECLTFSDASLDIVITSDVMEHVRLDDRAHREIHRVLRSGGIYLFTVPHNHACDLTLIRVQITDPNNPSKDVHLLEPEYHEDANSEEGAGVLAYRTYGRDLETHLADIGFEVKYFREDIPDQGILNTELYYCRKIK